MTAPRFADPLLTTWAPDAKGEGDATLLAELRLVLPSGEVFTVEEGARARASIPWWGRLFVSGDHYRRAWFVHDAAIRRGRLDHIDLLTAALIADNCPPARRWPILLGVAGWDIRRALRALLKT